MRRSALTLPVVLFLFSVSVTPDLQAACGVERWSVKTGTDSQAPSINLGTYISTTIYNLHQSAKPASLPPDSRLSPRETNQYRLSATLTKYKRETDSDYHLVIVDGSGRTMIIELPSINCVGGGSPFGTGISHARAQFDAKLTATSTMKTVTAPVTIKGIGFWDFLHGQTGVAPNGIEIHPVLDIAFTGPITASAPGPIAGDGEAPPAPALPDDMVEDNDGGRARVFRGGNAVGEVLFHGGPVVEDPRLRIVFAANHLDEATMRSIVQAARNISNDPGFLELGRYGIRTDGVMVEARELSREDSAPLAGPRGPRMVEISRIGETPEELTDLDVQRLLANAVGQGKIQHLDENVVTVVIVDRDTPLAVGTTKDWLSYHSQFHPTELAMPYVVVRADPNPEIVRSAMFGSIERALINPAGNGWF